MRSGRFAHNPPRELERARIFLFEIGQNPLKRPDPEK
jgi:hypothetical protein